MINFKNKVVVITGGGEGIGRALSNILCNSGAFVVINDIDDKKHRETKDFRQKSSNHCVCFKGDVAIKKEVNALSEFVKKKYGKVNLLINNAGVTAGRLDAVDVSTDLWEWVFGVNFWGTINCVNSFLPLMQATEDAKIVNICSIFSYFGMYQRSVYCASKSALKTYTASLRYELKKQGIDVVSVFPGMVKTNIIQNSKFWDSEKERIIVTKLYDRYASLSAEKAALKILTGIHKNRKRIHIGRDAKLIYHLLRLSPKIGEDLINHVITRTESRFRKKLELASVS